MEEDARMMEKNRLLLRGSKWAERHYPTIPLSALISPHHLFVLAAFFHVGFVFPPTHLAFNGKNVVFCTLQRCVKHVPDSTCSQKPGQILCSPVKKPTAVGSNMGSPCSAILLVLTMGHLLPISSWGEKYHQNHSQNHFDCINKLQMMLYPWY